MRSRFSSIEYLNSIINSFTDVPIDINSYQDNIWPWNTQKVYEHLKQPFYAAAWNATDEEIKENPISTGAILSNFMSNTLTLVKNSSIYGAWKMLLGSQKDWSMTHTHR